MRLRDLDRARWVRSGKHQALRVGTQGQFYVFRPFVDSETTMLVTRHIERRRRGWVEVPFRRHKQ